MSSPAIIPEMRVHCDDSQAEQNTASFPASANPLQCGGPDGSAATTRNCGACSELRGRLRSASNIHRLNPADKAEICCHADLSAVIGCSGGRRAGFFLKKISRPQSSPSAFADLAGDIKLGNLRLSKKTNIQKLRPLPDELLLAGSKLNGGGSEWELTETRVNSPWSSKAVS